MNIETKKLHTWMGRPITELSHEELLVVIDWAANEIERMRNDRIETARLMRELREIKNEL